MYGTAEHDLVHLGRDHDEAFHPHAQHETDRAADGRQEEYLAEDVSVHLTRREAEHLEGGDLAHALGDVDVREVVQHDERERRRRGDQHHDNHVHARHHVAVRVDGLVVVRHGLHASCGQKVVRELHAQVGVGRGDGQHGAVVGSLAHKLLVEGGTHIGVMVHIVLDDARDRGLVGRAGRVADGILLGQRDGIACAHAQLRRQLLGEHEAVVVQLHRMMADAGVQGHEAVERCRILGHDQLHALVLLVRPAGQHVLPHDQRMRGDERAVVEQVVDTPLLFA